MFKKNLRMYRKRKGYTKTELSKKAGLSSRTIEFLENGKLDNPTLGTIKKIANALGIKTEDLIK